MIECYDLSNQVKFMKKSQLKATYYDFQKGTKSALKQLCGRCGTTIFKNRAWL